MPYDEIDDVLAQIGALPYSKSNKGSLLPLPSVQQSHSSSTLGEPLSGRLSFPSLQEPRAIDRHGPLAQFIYGAGSPVLGAMAKLGWIEAKPKPQTLGETLANMAGSVLGWGAILALPGIGPALGGAAGAVTTALKGFSVTARVASTLGNAIVYGASLGAYEAWTEDKPIGKGALQSIGAFAAFGFLGKGLGAAAKKLGLTRPGTEELLQGIINRNKPILSVTAPETMAEARELGMLLRKSPTEQIEKALPQVIERIGKAANPLPSQIAVDDIGMRLTVGKPWHKLTPQRQGQLLTALLFEHPEKDTLLEPLFNIANVRKGLGVILNPKHADTKVLRVIASGTEAVKLTTEFSTEGMGPQAKIAAEKLLKGKNLGEQINAFQRMTKLLQSADVTHRKRNYGVKTIREMLNLTPVPGTEDKMLADLQRYSNNIALQQDLAWELGNKITNIIAMKPGIKLPPVEAVRNSILSGRRLKDIQLAWDKAPGESIYHKDIIKFFETVNGKTGKSYSPGMMMPQEIQVQYDALIKNLQKAGEPLVVAYQGQNRIPLEGIQFKSEVDAALKALTELPTGTMYTPGNMSESLLLQSELGPFLGKQLTPVWRMFGDSFANATRELSQRDIKFRFKWGEKTKEIRELIGVKGLSPKQEAEIGVRIGRAVDLELPTLRNKVHPVAERALATLEAIHTEQALKTEAGWFVGSDKVLATGADMIDSNAGYFLTSSVETAKAQGKNLYRAQLSLKKIFDPQKRPKELEKVLREIIRNKSIVDPDVLKEALLQGEPATYADSIVTKVLEQFGYKAHMQATAGKRYLRLLDKADIAKFDPVDLTKLLSPKDIEASIASIAKELNLPVSRVKAVFDKATPEMLQNIRNSSITEDYYLSNALMREMQYKAGTLKIDSDAAKEAAKMFGLHDTKELKGMYKYIRHLDTLFEESGLSFDQYTTGYLPHYKTNLKGKVSAEVEAYFQKRGHNIKDVKGYFWANEMTRENSLVDYEQNIFNAFPRYVSGLSKKIHYDEHIQNWTKTFKEVGMSDSRWQAFKDLRDHLVGVPSQFEQEADKLIHGFASTLGDQMKKAVGGKPTIEMSAILAELQIMGGLGYNPFTAVKNLTQKGLMLSEITDNGNWFEGLKWLFKGRAIRNTPEGKALLMHERIHTSRQFLEGMEMQQGAISRWLERMGVSPKVYQGVDKFRDWGMAFFKWSDSDNIKDTFLAKALYLMEEKGAPLVDATNIAQTTTMATQFMYGFDSPLLYKSAIGRQLGMFMSWPLNWAHLLWEQAVTKGEAHRAITTLGLFAIGSEVLSLTGLNFRSIHPVNTARGILPWAMLVEGEDQYPLALRSAAALKDYGVALAGGDPIAIDAAFDNLKRRLTPMVPAGIVTQRALNFVDIARNEWRSFDKRGRLKYETTPLEAGLGLFGPTTDTMRRVEEWQQVSKMDAYYRRMRQMAIEAYIDGDYSTFERWQEQLVANFGKWVEPQDIRQELELRGMTARERQLIGLPTSVREPFLAKYGNR